MVTLPRLADFDDLLHARPVDAAQTDRRALADEQDRLASLAQAAEMRRDGIHRVERDAGAQLPDVALGLLRFFSRAAHRKELAATPLELLHLLHQLVAIARELEVRQRRQRIHYRDEIVRAELLDERFERPPQRNHDLRRLVDVIVVEEQHEQPHVVACRFDLGVRRDRIWIDSRKSSGGMPSDG